MSDEERVNLSKDVHELILLLKGNPMDKNDIGLTGQVAKLTAKITKMENRDLMIYGAFILLTFFAGAGMVPVFEFIGKLFK